MHEPAIVLRLRVKYTGDDMSYKALGLRIKEMGKPLTGLDPMGQDSGDDPYIIDGYRPDVWPVPLAYDSLEPPGIFNCYLQNPCSVWHAMPGGYNTASEPIPPNGNQVPPDEGAGSPGDARGSNQGQALFRVTGTYTAPDLPEDISTVPTDTDLYDFPYTFIEIAQRYKIDRGWVSMPLAITDESVGRTSSVIKLHAPSAMRILTMSASRNGKPPAIPSLKEEQVDDNGNREVLNYLEVASKAPETLVDGRGRMYHVELTCHYLLEKAPTLTDKLRGSSSPLDMFSPDNHILDLAAIADQDSMQEAVQKALTFVHVHGWTLTEAIALTGACPQLVKKARRRTGKMAVYVLTPEMIRQQCDKFRRNNPRHRSSFCGTSAKGCSIREVPCFKPHR